MRNRRNKTIIISSLIISLLVSMFIVRFYSLSNDLKYLELIGIVDSLPNVTYLDSMQAVDYSLIGLEQIKQYMKAGKKSEKEYYFNSLKFISSYMQLEMKNT